MSARNTVCNLPFAQPRYNREQPSTTVLLEVNSLEFSRPQLRHTAVTTHCIDERTVKFLSTSPVMILQN